MARISLPFRAALQVASCVLLAAPACGQDETQLADWIRPAALRPGDTIGFVAPAGPAKWEPVRKYAEALRKAGYKVRVPEDVADRETGYLAGSDDERVAELNTMIRDPEVRAIFPVRGGYGLTRILDQIDYAALRADPKVITGYSDVTALHLAIAAKTRLVTFHSPMPMSNLWDSDNPDHAFAARWFRRAVFADQYEGDESGYAIDVPEEFRPVSVVGGKARGRLLGGNLTLLCSTLGTPYAIEPEGAILLIEDVDEAPYRVDRAFSRLRLAGVLDAIAGAVIGSFTEKVGDDVAEYDRIVQEYFGSLDVPVVMHYPVGHTRLNATLPHGGLVEVDGVVVRVAEDPVELE
jgi:muramoyltetrapeptide carboxypeptidase